MYAANVRFNDHAGKEQCYIWQGFDGKQLQSEAPMSSRARSRRAFGSFKDCQPPTQEIAEVSACEHPRYQPSPELYHGAGSSKEC
jgi:hypothetical protein